MTGDNRAGTLLSRKHFLQVGAAGAIAATGLRLAPGDARPAAALQSGARAVLELGRQVMGALASFEGGNAVGQVERQATQSIVKKHLGAIKYEEIDIQAGLDLHPSLYAWMAGYFSGTFERRSGAITTLDDKGNATRRLEFTNALITEIGFPAFDALSKDTGYISLKLQPDSTSTKPPVNVNVVSERGVKKWLPANFRLTIDGLDTTKVIKVDAITWRTSGPAAGDRDTPPQAELDFPHLAVTFPAASLDSWNDWSFDFVIAGNNVDNKERAGLIEALAGDLKTVLFTIQLKGLGIFKLTPPAVTPEPDKSPRFRAELYVEQMQFSVAP